MLLNTLAIYTPQKSFAPLTLYSLYLRSSGAPLHTLSKLYDVPVGFVTPTLFAVTEGWLLLDIR